MNQTETDVSHLVDAAFKEINCESARTHIPHDGDIAGVTIGHACATRLICNGHLKAFIAQTIPDLHNTIAECGVITCSVCHGEFYSVDDFIKVVWL